MESLKLQCAIVAWKDTREARRAVSDALPLLKKVKDVVVVEVIQEEPDCSAAHGRIDDLRSWLNLHGIAAVGRVFQFSEQEDPLKKLWQDGADLVVAGAYGHARLREWIFDGYTNDLLKRSPCCSFLSHSLN